jgi:wyosine [tRNA(Phe)-imidazoG37] synthetase (radical SAM superfamily)
MKYIYGPVNSWRLGKSLGVDLLSQKEKQCSFNCSYCQVGKTNFYVLERKEFVSTDEVLAEIMSVKDKGIDYITFSGNGEPTLASNLGEVIRKLKDTRKEKIAVLTNSSLLFLADVRQDLLQADMVQCKLDAASEQSFRVISSQDERMTLKEVVKGIKAFRNEYKGTLCLQIMFLESNLNEVEKFVQLVREIMPDRIELNTPLRESSEKPLSREQMEEVKKSFKEFRNVENVYDANRVKSVPIDESNTAKRRGKEK